MKKNMDCYRALKITHILFYGGLGLLILALLLLRLDAVSVSMSTALGVVGVLGCLGGLLVCFTCVRCPGCGESLMAGGRIPDKLPNFCPHCGKTL